jgi:OOP family OmpA-OmpF porin
MRLSTYVPVTLAVLLGGAACFGVAVAAVSAIETQSRREVTMQLVEAGHDWADVEIDGLQVILSGTAPDEAARFAAISTAGTVVDASRVIDQVQISQRDAASAPPFSVDILRNDAGVSLIGLVPAGEDRDAILERIGGIGAVEVTDLLEPATYPVPETWPAALGFGLDALASLPRSKITIEANRVTVTAIADSAAAKRATERGLRESVPAGVELVLDISAPRPVLTPFTLRFVKDERGTRFDACSADSPAAKDRILAAAREAGLPGEASCLVGLGQPSPRWAEAAVLAIRAVNEMGGGSVTFSDADVLLQAPPGTRQADFDRIAGALQTALPDVFSLKSVIPETPAAATSDATADDVVEFVATRSPEGQTLLRGRLPDELTRDAVQNFALARFGTDGTDMTARIAEGTPPGWGVRVLVALEALSELNDGSLAVRPDMIRVTGNTGNAEAQDEIARLVTGKLGEETNLVLDVTYVEALDPVAALPTPEECVERINAAIAVRKITFEPGSTSIESGALATIDRIAEALRECQTVKMEIGGHTDSQGSEGMNERLSQERADAVLTAIMARRVLTANLTAKGYGESEPIADNDTEDGREANRRIEFRLILPEDPDSTAAAGAETTEGDAPASESAAPEAGETEAAGTDAPEGEAAPMEEEAPAEEGTDQ